MWALIFSRTGITLMVLAALLGTIAFLRLDLGIKTHERDAARAGLIDPTTKAKWQDEYILAATNLTTCRGNVASLKAATIEQNASLEALGAQTAQRDAVIARARQAAQKSALAAQAAGDALSLYKAKGNDVCARLLDADRQVQEMMR